MPQAQGDGFILKQRVSVLEAIGGALGGNGCCEVENIYDLYDLQGQKVYELREDSNCCCRMCCTPVHRFNLHVYDAGAGPNPMQSAAVMSAHHPFKVPPCCCVFLDCCRSELIVYDGDIGSTKGACCSDESEAARTSAQIIGFVKQPVCGGGLSPAIEVWEQASQDQAGVVSGKGEPAFTVKGPCCCIGGLCGEMFCDTTFNIFPEKNTEGKEVASIKKLAGAREGMAGAAKELFTDSDTFQIEMPAGAGGGAKTGMLMTTVLIDYMFFESGNNIRCEDGGIVCVCTNFYCCGMIAPCTIKFGGGEGGG